MIELLDSKEVSVQYDTVDIRKDATGRLVAKRVQKWTTPQDYVKWVQYKEGYKLEPNALFQQLDSGRLRQDKEGNLLIAGGELTFSEMWAKKNHPVTDKELEEMQYQLDKDNFQLRRGRPCCPNCWRFEVTQDRDKGTCICGWKGKMSELQRRPEN